MATKKRKKKKARPSGIAAIKRVKLAPSTGPSFSVDASECLAGTCYSMREKVAEKAHELAGDAKPTPQSAIIDAFNFFSLGRFIIIPEDEPLVRKKKKKRVRRIKRKPAEESE